MDWLEYYNTDYGSVKVERLPRKQVDGFEMEQYRLSWIEGGGRHNMEVVLDGLVGEMLHRLLQETRRG